MLSLQSWVLRPHPISHITLLWISLDEVIPQLLVSKPLLCSKTRFFFFFRDDMRPPQFRQILWYHSATPTPRKGNTAFPDSSCCLRPSPLRLGLDLPNIAKLRRSSIHFMLRTATLLPKVGFTYRFSTGIASCTGYMLHGFLALPWQDLHLQAPVSLAGHTTRMTRMLRIPADLFYAGIECLVGCLTRRSLSRGGWKCDMGCSEGHRAGGDGEEEVWH